jgi:DNA mismatch repair protein MutS
LAGVPKEVLDRARQLLGELAVQHIARPKISRRGNRSVEKDTSQLALFVDPAVELMQALAGTNLDAMSPLQAFELLREWKKKYGK